MREFIRREAWGEIAVLTIDNPPVNALSRGVVEAIRRAVKTEQDEPDIRAIVLAAAGKTFVAGADITEFRRLRAGSSIPDLNPAIWAVEDSVKPVIAAIHGTALGGGFELALAAHYRVATAESQVGQPETRIGLIPGAGGTQRLPRLAGVATAVEMCAFGEPVSAGEALRLGILDRLIEEDLLTGAVRFAREVLRDAAPVKTRDRNEKLGREEENERVFAAARERSRKTRRNLAAPLAAIKAVEYATKLPFAEGCKKETELFHERLFSTEAQALIHVFFAERGAAKVPDTGSGKGVLPVRKVGVVGAGTMGGGIAMAFANAGIPVVVKETEGAALERGTGAMRKNYEASVTRGKMTQGQMDGRLELIESQLSYDGFEQLDLVVEAAFESLAVKKEIFAELDRVTRPDCILTSNTSSLSIDAMAEATTRPSRVAGLHFFSPANVMRLIELVRGEATSSEAVAACMKVAKQLGKVAVVVRNAPGFVGNRMMFAYMREAQFLAEEGSTPWHIDRVLTEWGMRMGIFGVEDLSGIDVFWRMRQEARKQGETPGRKPLVADQLYAMGRFGQKTGAGWFRYDENRNAVRDVVVEALIEESAREAGIGRREVRDSEIVERTLYALINEGARILEEGIAVRASDIDVIYVNGYGFPAYRGGPMFYADTIGLETVLGRIEDFERGQGEQWRPAGLLKQLAAAGRTFASLDAETAQLRSSPTIV